MDSVNKKDQINIQRILDKFSINIYNAYSPIPHEKALNLKTSIKLLNNL